MSKRAAATLGWLSKNQYESNKFFKSEALPDGVSALPTMYSHDRSKTAQSRHEVDDALNVFRGVTKF